MTVRSRLSVLALLGLTISPCAQATVLTFDRDPQFSTTFSSTTNRLYGSPDADHFPDYGDRVAFEGNPGTVTIDASAARSQPANTTKFVYGTTAGQTPNVVVEYPFFGAGTFSPNEGMFFYRDTTNTDPVLFPFRSGSALERMATFTADDGWAVRLDEFHLGVFGFSRQIRYIQVVGIKPDNSEVVLWSEGTLGSGSIIIPAAGRTFTITDFIDPLVYKKLALDYQPHATTAHNNYSFDNIVFAQIPEPASASMLAAGLIMALRRRGRPA